MDIHSAYKKLGLQPLDTFLLHGGAGDRHIGATTWMTVSAAIHVLKKGDVVLVGHNLGYAETMAYQCLKYLGQFQGGGQLHRQVARRWEVNGNCLHWESVRTIRRFLTGRDSDQYKVFDDGKWKLKAMTWKQGPFARIRVISLTTDGRYAATDEDGDFLVELDREGAEQVVGDGWKVEQRGW